MRLAWLELHRFRAHLEMRFEPGEGVNVLVGENGAGKTSVLEAIGYLSSLRSFRGSPDSSLVTDGSDGAIVRGEFEAGDRLSRVEVEIAAEGRRRVLLDGKRARGRAELAERVALVAFLPDDLDLVKRGPAYRRDYLDDAATQVWPVAATEQVEYDRVVRQRNALLRREGHQADPTTLDVLDGRLADLGAAVIGRRLAVRSLLEPVASGLYGDLSDEPGQIEWRYEAAGLGEPEPDAGPDDLAPLLADAIAEARASDLDRRMTTVGPHRDEIVVLLDGRDARTRASQGEQRSIALGFRVAVYRVLAERRGTPPVLLLDDVFSELDEGRGERLVEQMPSGQVFVTSARDEEVPLVGDRWTVTTGEVRRA
ncbi:MAG: DNA replication/repair protein RecF [Acidimicrobiia bacterium]